MSQLHGLTALGKPTTHGHAVRPAAHATWRLVAPHPRPASAPHAPSLRCHSSLPQSSDPAPAIPTASTPVPAADAGEAVSLLGTAWDPEGLFSRSNPLNFAASQQMGDLIARRERERAARRAAATVPALTTTASTPVTTASPAAAPHAPATAAATTTTASLPPLPPGTRPIRPLPAPPAPQSTTSDSITPPPPQHGWRPADLPPEVVSELESLLRRDFMPVDLGWPGLAVLHLDPPVLAVEGFFSGELCDRMVQLAEGSGRMVASRIGASNVAASYGTTTSARRTSTGMMVTPGSAGPAMDAVVAELQARGKKLLRADEGPAWGPQGRMPRSGQYCYESLQVARYDRGQHFLAHEDGFPAAIAAANGFQRHATLLVYLNDVAEGGATRFDYLDLAVQPRKGRLLLFFPALQDGTSDVRSLHTAEDAVDVKYATQQWIARGLPQPGANQTSQKIQDSMVRRHEEEFEQRERAGRQAKSSKAAAKSGKGFGSKK